MKRVSTRKLRRARSAQTSLRGRRPHPLGISLARFSSAVAVAAALFAGVSSAGAATYYWDPDANAGNNVLTSQAGLGNSGAVGFLAGAAQTYAATDLKFWDGSSASDVVWTNSFSDSLTLGGPLTGGVITFNAPFSTNGLTFNTGGYSTTLTATNSITLGGTNPFVTANANASIGTVALATINGTAGFTKTGSGTLTVLGNNTGLSGPITVSGGTLQAQSATANQATALGSGTITLNLGTLNLRNEAAGNSQILAIAYANPIAVNGNSAINVDRVTATTGDTISVPSLSLNNSTITVTGSANNYGFQVVGATTLAGALSTINTTLTFVAGSTANVTTNMLALSGGVTGAGALNKQGAGTINLFGDATVNTYSGGTNIFTGAITLANSAAKAGTGNIIVNPATALAITNAAGVTFSGGQTLAVQSSPASLGIIRVDSTVSDVVAGSSLGSTFISPYGASFQINTGAVNYTTAGVAGAAATYTQNIDLTAIGSTAAGNGPIYLGASTSSTISGTIKAAAGNTLRFGGSGTLTMATLSQLSSQNDPGTLLAFGSPVANVSAGAGFTVAAGSGTYAVNNANAALTGAVTVNKLAVVNVAGTALLTESPLGTGPIYLLGGTLNTTATNFVGTAPQLGNTTINVYQSPSATSGLILDNSAVTTTAGGGTTNLRLAGTSTLGLYSGNFNYLGSNTASTVTTQNVATLNASGGSTINLTTSATAASNADAVLNVTGNLNRLDQGTIVFARVGTTQPASFGLNASGTSDSRVFLNVAGSPLTPTSGMIAPWLIDGTSNTFLTYGANGIAGLGVTYGTAGNFDVNATTPAILQASTATQKVDVTAAAALTGPASVYALRVGNVAVTGAFLLTVNGNTTDGAGVIFNSTTTQADTNNWSFGPTAGNAEAILYANTSAIVTTLSGTVAATGLTKFGPGTISLTGTNTGLAGTITVNQGILNATGVGLNFRPVTVNGGTLQINQAVGLNIYNNDVTINGDSILDTGTGLTPRIRSLVVNARTGSTDPMTLNVIAGGLAVTGSTATSTPALTLTGPVNLNAAGAAVPVILGNGALGTEAISGGGALNKWGSGQVVIASPSPNYSGAITINGVGGNNNNNLLRSQDAGTATDKPFGTGAIVVNPGGVLSVARPENTTGNASVTLRSDLNGLATLAVNYNGNTALPTGLTFNRATLGGPFSAILAIDAIGYSGAVDLNAFGGGLAFLGSANQTGNYTGTMNPSTVGLIGSVPSTTTGTPFTTSAATGVYRIGTGGGTTQFLGAAGQFAINNDIQVGAISNVHQFTSVSLGNGNGTAAIYNVNSGFNGNVILNGSTTGLGQGNLVVGNDGALGTGTIIFNGGGIQADGATGLPFLTPVRTISNAIQFAGDVLFNGSTDLRITSALALAPGQTGVTRTLNVANTTGLTILAGAITDGAGGSTNSITKAGAGALVLTGGALNTYTGFTNIAAGTLVVTSDSDIPTTSQIIMAGGSLGVWNNSFTTTRNYVATSTVSGFDIGAAKTLTQSVLSNISGNTTITKNGYGTLVLQGDNSVNGTNALQVNAGTASVGANVNIGDPAINGVVLLNAVPSTTVIPATLLVTSSFSTVRAINSISASSGVINVASGVNFTSTGVINLGAGNFVKTGPGTLTTTAANTGTLATISDGIWQTTGNQPFATTSLVNFNGGTLLLNNVTTAQTVATSGNVAYNGGGHLALQTVAGFNSTLNTTGSFNRGLAGTLVIDGGTVGTLGATGTGSVRVNPTNLFGFNARATALNNGIFGASIISADATGLGNFVGNDATLGLKPWDLATGAATTLSGTQPALIGNITTTQTLTGTNSIYGFRTNSDVNGGILKIGSVNNIVQGGIILNGSNTISAGLVFDPSSTGTIALANGATTTATTAVTVTSTAGLTVGMPISGPNIPAGATITAITSTTALTISTNATATATAQSFTASQGTTTSGEGLVYVAPTQTASLTGNILGTSLVKYGSGNLTLNGAGQNILGQLTVQEGTLKVGAASNFNKFQTDLVLNDRGTLDLNGLNTTFNSLANSSSVTVGGGIIGNSSTTANASLILNGGPATLLTNFGGQIVDVLGAGTKTTALVKNGLGTLVLGIYNTTNTAANDNTYTGGTTVTLGILRAQNPLALGTGAVTLLGGTLDLMSNGGGINGTIILGSQAGAGNTVNVAGPATINVDRVAANTGNSWQIGNLNLSENNLNITGANSYRLRASGTTTIVGTFASLTGGTASVGGTLELAGPIVSTNGGALNKFGADQSRYLLISNGSTSTPNTYSGGTNIQSGTLIVGATTGSPLGTGRVNVFGIGTLRLTGLDSTNWANGQIGGVAGVGGAPVKVHSVINNLAEIGLDVDTIPIATLQSWLNAPGVLNNSYGTVGIALTRPFWTQPLDQSAIGDGKTFLTGGINNEVDYIAATLAPGLGDGTATRIYRLAPGGNNNFAFTGADNVFSDYGGATQVQIGSPLSIANNAALGQTGNTVIIRNSNSYTGGTIIWKGSFLQIETGASPGTSNSPLGTGQVDVWGTLTAAGQNGSYVNAATGLNTNAFVLHPGGQININDTAGLVAGGNGRWSDSAALNLNGGTLTFNGAVGYVSNETIGAVTADKLGRIIVSRSLTSGTATLSTPNLIRIAPVIGNANGAGALLLQGSANGSFGIPASTTITTPDNGLYDRFIITGTAPTLGGKTIIGTGVTATLAAAGVVAPWVINTNDAGGLPTFMTYSPLQTAVPTAALNTGFQSLVTAGSPGATALASVNADGTYLVGANQVGYSRVFGTGTGAATVASGLTTGVETVDLNSTATVTLVDADTSIYALRLNNSLNPLAGPGLARSLTIVGGGLIQATANATINLAPVPTNAAAQPMTLNFGAVGTPAEAVIFATNTLTINAQIVAKGLTKTATQGSGSNIILTGDNILTGPVTIDGGIIQAQNTVSGIGSAVPGVFNGQDVYLGGAANRDASRLILNATVGNAVSALLASGFNATAKLAGTVFINGDSDLDNNNNGISQRITNLTFADLGPQKPILVHLGSNMYVEGTTTLAQDTVFDMYFNNSYSATLAGKITGPGGVGANGTLNKFGNGLLLLGSGINDYAGGTTVNGTTPGATSILAAMFRGTGTPFGTGGITVNPGGALRLLDAANIASNTLNVISDGVGLGGLNFAYTATNGQITALFNTTTTPTVGKANFTSSGDFIGVIGLDANNWNTAINMATLETAAIATNPLLLTGKSLWLGTSNAPGQTYLNGNQVNYAAATLTPGLDNVLRIGGGGNQGQLNLGGGQFENVLTAATTSLLVGTDTGGNTANGPVYVNGQIGMLELSTRNLLFTGSVTVANGSQLTLASGNSLPNASAINVNGGNINIRSAQTVSTPINVTGDFFRSGENSGFDNGTFSGAVNLAPNGAGGTRSFSIGSNAIGFTGVISDAGTGTGASNIIRTSNQTANNLQGSVIFHGLNTYHGTTQVLNGFLYAGTDVQPNAPGAFGNSDTPLGIGLTGNGGANSAASLGIAGQFAFGRDLIVGVNGPSGSNINEFRNSTLQTAIMTGGINLGFGTGAAGTGLTISSFSTANGVGGMIDLQGPLTGIGGLQIGGLGNTTSIIRLSASANGLGTSTYTGGTNIFNGRLQIGADTNFTGTTAAPIILSGPLGTGPLFLGKQGSNTTGQGNQNPGFVQIDAVGADRVIVNQLGAINASASTTLQFGGHQSLTFTSAMDVNSNAALFARTFNVAATQGTVTFSGNLSSSGALSANIVKSGPGTLVLTGTNTFTSSGTAPVTPTAITGGVLRVNSDVSLGAVSATNTLLTIAGTTANNNAGRLEVAGANTVTFNAATSNRSLSLGASAGVIVSNASGILQLDTAVLGVNPFNKEGPGTLRLNNIANLFTAFTIGGTPTGGGTVSTTATSGTPFGTSIILNNGTLSLIATTPAQAITVPTVEFRGGSYVQLNKGTTGSALTATALQRGTVVTQGTLTLLPSALANLGAGASATSENVITSSAFANTAGMLTLPDVYARLTGSGQDADFVNYGGANGFTLRTANVGSDGTTIAATLAAGNAIIPAALAADASQTAPQTVNAVRTSADLASPGQTLTITSGGLIMNKNTASAVPNAGVTISTNLVFGASAAAPGEALVYTADGTTGTTPTINGGFTSANFTKSGPGNLLIGGTNTNVMAPIVTGIGLRSLQINEGTLSFAGQTSLPSNGLLLAGSSPILISPMDTGTLDLAGQSLTFAGLGNATTSNLTATGNLINSGGAVTLTLNGTGNLALASTVITQFNGLINGNIALIKSGTSTQILGANTAAGIGGNTYTGLTTPANFTTAVGTVINAGLITSASGLFTPLGTLQAKGVNSLGSGPIGLSGGILEFNNAILGSDMYTNQAAVLQGGVNGYDVVVPATNNFGSSNTTSTFVTTNTVNFQAINSLNVSAPVITFAGASGNGILVKGATTFNQDTTINNVQQSFLAGTVSASGKTLTKIGASALFLSGTGGDANGTGTAANSVGGWNILAGTIDVRTVSDGSSSPLGVNNSILLDAATLTFRIDGDNLGDAQDLSTFSTNTLVNGSLTAASSANYFSSSNNVLNVGTLSSGTNKTVQFQQLQFGGPLGTAFLSTAALNNNYPVEFLSGLTMIKDAYLSINNTTSPLTLSTTLSGNGSLFKQGGGELDINAVGTYTGGTVTNGGAIYFGSFRGNTRTLSTGTLAVPTATLGNGNITLNPSALIRFNSTANLKTGQLVDLRSSLTNYAVIGIGDNSAISAYNLRLPQAFGAVNSNLLTAVNHGGGVLAINSVYSQPIDLARLGDGTTFLGSNGNGAGVTTATSLNGTYVGATAIGASSTSYNFGAANANNTRPAYRLGGGGAFLNLGTIGGSETAALVDDSLNGVGPAVATSVVVGAPLTNTANGTGAIIGNGTTPGVFFNTPQTYTGTTLVNNASTLEIRNTVTTSGYETFGVLAAGGSAGTFVTAAPAGPSVTVHPGATIRLDNSLDLLPVATTAGRWGDAAPVVLDGSTFQVIGNSGTDLKEVVGAVTVNGYSVLTPRSMFAARNMEINAASIGRNTGGVLSIEGTTAAQIGSSERVTAGTIANYAGNQVAPFTTSAPGGVGAVINGMVVPWMYDNRDSQFLTYNGDSGFVAAGFNYVLASAGTLTATTAAVTGTERLLVNGATANLGGSFNLNVWALRTDFGIGQVTATDTTNTVTIGSGGLIDTASLSITPKLVFGSSGTPVEAVINVTANTLTLGDIANPTVGQITASAITKGSAGTLSLDAEQATFNGPINVGGTGGLTLRTNATATNPVLFSGTTTAGGLGGAANTISINGLNAQLNLRSDHSQTYGQVGVGGVATELGAETFQTGGIILRAGNPLTQITFDRAASTTVTNQGISISGGLTFGGSAGDQGQTLTLQTLDGMNAQGTGFNFWVNGVTNLGPAGNAIFNLTNLGTNNGATAMSLAGGITGAGTLVREGSGGTLFLGVNGVAPAAGAGSNFAGGVTVIQNTLQGNALAPAGLANAVVTVLAANSMFGSGPITLVGGTLNARVDSASGIAVIGAGTAITVANLTTQTFNMPNAVTVLGNTTINTDRIGDLQILPNASVTSGSNIATVVNGTTAGLKIGQTISGTSVSGTVTAVTDSTHFTMSANASGTGTQTTTITAVSAYTNNIIGFSALNIGGQTLTVSSADTYGLGFSAVNLSSTPTFNVPTSAQDLNLTGITDNGGGLYIVKNGTGGQLWINSSTANTYSGGTYINQGTMRFGTQLAASATAQAGTGPIQINPQGALRLEAIGNLNIAAGQKVVALGIPASFPVIRALNPFTQASLVSAFSASSTNANLRIDGSNAGITDLGAIGDGSFYFGSQGSLTMTVTNTTSGVNVLGAGSGNTYRLGVNDANTSTLTLAGTVAANPVLAGANRLQVGSLAVGGNNGTGILTLNATNTYSVGTTVVRGSTLNWSTSNNGTGTNTPLGTGSLDVFGVANANAIAAGGNGNTGMFNQGGNTATLHPGSTVLISNVGATSAPGVINNRWSDGNALGLPIALNGSAFSYNGPAFAATSSENFTNFSFNAGSRVLSTTATANSHTLLTVTGTFTRNTGATLVFAPSAAALLGATSLTSLSQQFLISTVAQRPTLQAANLMAPAYFIDGTGNSFVTYDSSLGFKDATYTSSVNGAFPTGFTAGNQLVDVNTAASTLQDNPSIYALRTNQSINNSPGQINTITLNGAGTGGGLLFSAASTVSPNLNFGGFEGLIYTANITAQLSGDISGVSSAGITKFGQGVLQINKDQSDLARGTGTGYSSGWTVNEGQLIPAVFGALGNATATNTVTLNGSTVTAANSPIVNAATLRLQLNQANTGIAYYSMGNLNVLDNGGISYDPQADDRTQALGSASALSNVVVTSTGGSLLDAQFSFNTNRNRTNLIVGDLSIVDAAATTGGGVQVNIADSVVAGLTNGVSSGLSVASLTGASDTHITKWGSGALYVRGASTFSGAVNIEQGALQINDPASLGSGVGTNVVTVKRYGTLDINTPNFARTDVIFQAGSLLRLTADGALGTTTYTSAAPLNLGGGTLQVANDQTTTVAAINMTGGGSIEGFVRQDDTLFVSLTAGTRAVYRTLGSGVTFNLAGNSFLGQNINQGSNGLDDGIQSNVFNPLTNAASGSLLEIKGAIGGPGSLTKQGFDAVTISGANTYSGGTNVIQGLLRAGATNVLGSSDNTVPNIGKGNLSTTGAGAFDLNGFDQSVGLLSSALVTAGTAGYITNTATTFNILTVGNGITGAGLTDYRGTIQYNVGLTKVGTAVQALSNNNTYTGPTVVSGGTLAISGSISATSSIDVQTGGTLSLAGLNTNTDRVANAPIQLSGGTLAFDNSLSNATEHLGPVTAASASSVIDFSTGSGNTVQFSSINTITFTGFSIYNWSGNLYSVLVTDDPGTPSTQDRLRFDGPTGLTGAQLGQINFYSDNGATLIGTGNEITFNGGPGTEIVPVPEPSSTALLGGAALLGLASYRRRRQAAAR